MVPSKFKHFGCEHLAHELGSSDFVLLPIYYPLGLILLPDCLHDQFEALLTVVGDEDGLGSLLPIHRLPQLVYQFRLIIICGSREHAVIGIG